MYASDLAQLKRAGSIAVATIAHARTFIRKGMPLLEIAERIEAHIVQLGGKPAFPVNLSINEVAAHATPAYNETAIAQGLLKVDLGVHIDGFVADTAVSLDLEDSEENAHLIAAAEAALASAVSLVSQERSPPMRAIGAAIATTLEAHSFQPIRNLSGHSIQRWDLHAGMTVPNYDNVQEKNLNPGVYAIEPFATLTTGSGTVRDGKPSGIYSMEKESPVRDTFARQVLAYILENYETLPFCSRWIVKHFGTRSLIALARLEQAGIVHQYAQLVEQAGTKVAQAEHTIIVTEKEMVVTTL